MRRNLENLGSTDHSNITQAAYDNRWTPANPNGTVMRAGNDDTNALPCFSNRFVEERHLRAPQKREPGLQLHLQGAVRHPLGAAVRASVTNLATITKYTGYDPEVNAYGQDPALPRRGPGQLPHGPQLLAGRQCWLLT